MVKPAKYGASTAPRSASPRRKRSPSIRPSDVPTSSAQPSGPEAPLPAADRPRVVRAIYQSMLAAMGPSNWWPSENPFEIAVGAILTQNAAWSNVEKAMANLRREDVLNPHALLAVPQDALATLIRPAGYYNLKAVRLRNLLTYMVDQALTRGLDPTDRDLGMLRNRPLQELRPELLGITGVGPETADAILLYALELPTFVVDAYTRRMAARHGLIQASDDYHEIQAIFAQAMPQDVSVFNEYHALIVRLGQGWCAKQQPRCAGCPLEHLLP